MTPGATGDGTGRVPVCAVDDVPEGGCLAVADGRVLLTRIDGQVKAYPNRCLHQDTPLDGGLVRNGVLQCPLHFWRYRLVDGRRVGRRSGLEHLPCHVDDGVVHVTIPTLPTGSIREQLLDHARTWSRDA